VNARFGRRVRLVNLPGLLVGICSAFKVSCLSLPRRKPGQN